ncbi:MAG: 3-methyladenine DNA glycosylase [Balneolaceae bacterium]|nr:MAG: 3-methyladenine DNA glycosylase [Balneolaceae bacterium]
MQLLTTSDRQLRLPKHEWIRLKKNHREVLAAILDPYLDARSKQEKNPVLDFLFEYYKFRPAHLMRWSPGPGVVLELSDSDESLLPELSELLVEDGAAYLNPALFPKKRLRAIRWMLSVLKNSRSNKPMFGCFGMHEWAMVYRAGEIRHEQIPLRLPPDEIARFVESRPLLCTHFDAFRFFTEPARPLNKHHLSRDTFADMEQPGCIHTNMDLYKWAYKLYPWISSELIREAFLNACEARKTDMQASPYDARSFGLEPIKIETDEGRKEYITRQMEIYENSMPIREKLIDAYERVLEWGEG